MEDRALERERLAAVPGAGDEARILSMTDAGEELGWAAVTVSGELLTIHRLQAAGYGGEEKPDLMQNMTLDFLLRSAASYGEHHGAQNILAACGECFGFFAMHGFKENEEGLPAGPMSLLVHYE